MINRLLSDLSRLSAALFVAFRAAVSAGCLWAATTSYAVAQQFHDNKTATQLVEGFDAVFGGMHPHARAVHTKGVVVQGAFVPSSSAASLSRAIHLNGGAIPVIVRFSNFAGVPDIADGAPEASPRGMAIRFQLPDGVDTDIVAHSYNGFPAATPDDFIGFLHAVAEPETLATFAKSRPAVQAFLAALKPTPASYATEHYFGVNAFRFTNTAGLSQYGRYQLIPMAGEHHLTPEQADQKPKSFLLDELAARLASGQVDFHLIVQLAADGDKISDGSLPWPADRPTVELGTITLRTLAPEQVQIQQMLRFQPTNLVGGIAPSEDPMLLARTQAYRVSAERRAGPE